MCCGLKSSTCQKLKYMLLNVFRAKQKPVCTWVLHVASTHRSTQRDRVPDADSGACAVLRWRGFRSTQAKVPEDRLRHAWPTTARRRDIVNYKWSCPISVLAMAWLEVIPELPVPPCTRCAVSCQGDWCFQMQKHFLHEIFALRSRVCNMFRS